MISVVNPIKRIVKSPVLLGTFLFFAACSDEPETAGKESQETKETYYLKMVGETQGTTYSVIFDASQGGVTQEQIDSLLIEFDNSLSTYNPGSLVTHFNAYGEVEPDDKLKEVLRLSRSVWKTSGGYFNPALYPIIELWGFGLSETEEVRKEDVDSLLAYTHLEDVVYDSLNNLLTATNHNAIEFNAIAQGYSVDLVSNFLQSRGITNHMVDIGGEIFTMGNNVNGGKWRLGIDKPEVERTNTPAIIIELSGKALATSGSYRKFRMVNGRRVTHTIDPFTGYPVENNLLSVSIIADNAAIADAYATALMVMGLEKSREFLREHPELRLEAFLIYDENGAYKTYRTEGFNTYVAD